MVLCLTCRAEGWLDSAGFDAVKDFGAQTDFDAAGFLQGLLTGELPGGATALKGYIEALMSQARQSLTALLRALLIPVTACAALRLAVGKEAAAAGMADLVCALCCSLALADVFLEARTEAAALMEALRQAMRTLTPVMVSACALSGAPVTAGLLAPLAAEGADLAGYALRDVGLSLCSMAGAVAVAGSLSRRFPLDKLFGLLCGAVKGLAAMSALLFGALMSVQGAMGVSRDAAAVRAARAALEGLVPVIGGGLSDSAGALAVSTVTLRRAVGFTGAAAALHLCVGPLTRLVGAMLSARLAAAVLEPLNEGTAVRIASRFGTVLELLTALCLMCGIMAALLAGGCAACLGSALG